ncbi:virulence factor [Xanthomonas campestris]|uniref:virulence factor n=1 Tax=Xanthomonas campestris TaxID=339 RepID=UPI002368C99F|nr:virulence factor [Xanthomonas campestris]MEB2111723.1 virulence factor [Xanthomonas campestris pv. campestris]MEA9487973.1 virulence factor [Xanthomonas campestris]MEA9506861.1 virulence factor [Xanthomonas campestris]WDJ83554.1 virulence factor [Xanthomonas campestris pv. incanae]WDK27358.1 virulence factor [Xanthomonas campestris pv. incanae]
MTWGITLFRWIVALLFIAGSGYAVARHLQDGNTAGNYGAVEVVRPEGTPKAMVVLLPDSAHAEQGQQLADLLSDDGALVAVVDTARYRTRARSRHAACSALADDAERLGKKLLRAEHVDAFLPPVLVGQGDGALLARQAVANAAPDVLGGVVVADGDATGTGLACLHDVPDPNQGFLDAQVEDAGPAQIAAATRGHFQAAQAQGLADLPLVELHAPGSDRLVVLLSGDGGWREMDKGIAARLQQQGVSVVGFNSLRYFWGSRTPQQVGVDLDRIIATYQQRWHARHVALVGYSFGADVLPFAFPELPAARRDAVQFVGLLGLAHQADFKVRVGGWLGWHNEAERPIAPALQALDAHRLQCIYGEQEKDTLCPELRARGVEVIARPGGHHFDRDPGALADILLQGWQRAAQLPGHA